MIERLNNTLVYWESFYGADRSEVSIPLRFKGILNNLNDISMDDRYIEICGITEAEIHRNLEPELRELGKAQDITYEKVCQELKERYDGYHFTENSIGGT